MPLRIARAEHLPWQSIREGREDTSVDPDAKVMCLLRMSHLGYSVETQFCVQQSISSSLPNQAKPSEASIIENYII